MKIDNDTTLAAAFVELMRLGMHSFSFTRVPTTLIDPRVVKLAAGYGERFVYAHGHDVAEAFEQLRDKIERGVADEVRRSDR